MNSSFEYKMQCLTLVDRVLQEVSSSPNKLAFTFLRGGEGRGESLTYAELDRQARMVASELLSSMGENSSRMALLVYPQGLEFVVALMGCLYAGVVAIPVVYEHVSRFIEGRENFATIAKITEANTVLTLSSLNNRIKSCANSPLNGFHVLSTDVINNNGSDPSCIDPNDIALIQYTSGSTKIPKAVVITHTNLVENCYLYRYMARIKPTDVIVSWMPHFHNTCLIMGILQSIYSGIHCVLLDPADVIQNPFRWLRAVSEFSGSITLGPDFAYNLCVEKIEDVSKLDLRNLEVAINGSQAVHGETMRKFAKKFSSCGFRYNAFTPAWGLSEATVLATMGYRMEEPAICYVDPTALQSGKVVCIDKGDPIAQEVISCGHQLPGQKLSIVNPRTFKECAKDEVGEIWLKSAGSRPNGYWKQPEKTREIFGGYLSDNGDGPFLRTGDVGFYMDGNLFVSGRLKEMLVIRGKNFYPQDIEMVVGNSDLRLNPNKCMAFSIVVNNEERLTLVCELREGDGRNGTTELFENIRSVVASKFGLSVYATVFIESGNIPKTGSGKISRHLVRKAFQQKTLQGVVAYHGLKFKRSVVSYDKE